MAGRHDAAELLRRSGWRFDMAQTLAHCNQALTFNRGAPNTAEELTFYASPSTSGVEAQYLNNEIDDWFQGESLDDVLEELRRSSHRIL
jgi:hypothetical protein